MTTTALTIPITLLPAVSLCPLVMATGILLMGLADMAWDSVLHSVLPMVLDSGTPILPGTAILCGTAGIILISTILTMEDV